VVGTKVPADTVAVAMILTQFAVSLRCTFLSYSGVKRQLPLYARRLKPRMEAPAAASLERPMENPPSRQERSTTNVLRTPSRNVSSHQSLEQPTMVQNTKVQQFVHDHKVLKS
jgi:hypothetical protein